MVFCGRPSRGCENCRKLHVKCDEQRPECSRCSKMKRACMGYRDQLDLRFRDETATVQARLRRPAKRIGVTTALASVVSPDSCSLLLPTLEDVVLSHFYHTITASLPDANHARYLHLQLPALYSQSGSCSALRLSTQAISYALAGKFDRNLSQLSKKRYGQAISAINAAIQDPHQVKDDQTLYAVLLLCGYEITLSINIQTITCDLEIPVGWGAHIDGAAALLRFRGKQSLNEPFSRRLYLYVRRAIVLSHMQISKSIDTIPGEVDDIYFPHDDAEDRLITRIMNIPNLQCLANSLLSQSARTCKESAVVNLIRSAKNLDTDVSNWPHTLPATWSYTVATSTNVPSDLNFSGPESTPSQIHRYRDIYTARVWNLYRVSRLILQSIILRSTTWLSTKLVFNQQDTNVASAERTSEDLVNGICASVPFLMGRDSSEMRLPVSNDLEQKAFWPRTATENGSTSTQTGRYSLIWPLYIACSVSSISDSSRGWMRLQLRRIGESGEPLAKLLATSESQTLSGGPENLRFDCI